MTYRSINALLLFLVLKKRMGETQIRRNSDQVKRPRK